MIDKERYNAAYKLIKQLRETDDTDHKIELASIALQNAYDEGHDEGFDKGYDACAL